MLHVHVYVHQNHTLTKTTAKKYAQKNTYTGYMYIFMPTGIIHKHPSIHKITYIVHVHVYMHRNICVSEQVS